MRIGIIGHGALGAMYASYFQGVQGAEPFFIAGGQRYIRLKETELLVNGRPLRIPVEAAGEADRPANLLLVAVKHHHLDQAVEDIGSHIGEQTILMSVMNGLDSEQVLARRYGDEHLLYAVALAMDAVRSGSETTFTSSGKLLIGRAQNRGEADADLRQVQQLCSSAGLDWETPQDMIRSLWWKFMINIGVNQVTAVLQEPDRVLQESGEGHHLMTEAMAEVIDCAAAEGVRLTHQDIEHWCSLMKGLPPEARTSMCQDVEARRKTEVEMFAGKLMELADQHGLSVPVNRTLYRLIRAKEYMYLKR